MKKLFQISALFLLIIGAFTVQLGSTPVLVDDDVGIENINILDYSDNAVLVVDLEMKVPVTAPMKCPLLETKTSIVKSGKDIVCDYAISNDYAVNRQLANKIKNSKGYQTNVPEQIIIDGLYRLEIGDRFRQNLKA